MNIAHPMQREVSGHDDADGRIQRRAKMANANRWHYVLLAFLVTTFGLGNVRDSALCNAESCSTFFSGMGAVEMAIEYLASGVTTYDLPFKMHPVSALDLHSLTRPILAARYGAAHVTMECNILQLFDLPMWSEEWGWELKLQVLLGAPMRDTYVSPSGETWSIPTADCDCSGSPCRDFSPNNAYRRDGRDGVNNSAFLAWCAWHIRRGTKILFHENVQQFDMLWAVGILSLYFSCVVLFISPEDVLFDSTARSRMLICAARRGVTKFRVDVNDAYEKMKDYFRATPLANQCITVGDIFQADAAEIQTEEYEQCMMRKVCPRPAGGDLQYSLHETLQKYIRNYNFMFWSMFGILPHICPWLVFNLQDNPHGRLTWSAHSKKLPSLRRDSRYIWSSFHLRWATFLERLSAFGFPTYQESAEAARVPLYSPAIRDVPAQMMLGESMVVGSVGAAMGLALSCIEILDCE